MSPVRYRLRSLGPSSGREPPLPVGIGVTDGLRSCGTLAVGMRLLVAVDGTPDSDRALDHGLTLARAAGAELVLVHAVQPAVDEETAPEPVSGPAEVGDRLVMESTAEAEERGAGVLDSAADRIDGDDVEVGRELVYGPPAEAIPEFAERTGADGILVGHRDLSEEHERLLGSVAKQLIERSSVPVTVVR